MKTTYLRFKFFLLTLVSAPYFSFAQEVETDGANQTITSPSIKLINPLAKGGVNDIPTLVREILKIIITIGVPVIALAIIYAGFKFVAAQGNPEKLKKAKDTFVYVIIGAAILLAAYAIAEAIDATVAAIRGN
ncbi:hypothetical protein KC901_00825 [Patescibacteria group bacterium]|nr:hypothetical protein [Patescibacteria group bacterium]